MDSIIGWLDFHPWAANALVLAIVTTCTVVILAAICGIIYFGLFIRRLTISRNWKSFIAKPIPAVTGGKGPGFQVKFAELERATQDVVEQHEERLRKLEEGVTALQDRADEKK